MNDPASNLVPSPIAISIEPSQDALVVGAEFSVFVEITNQRAEDVVVVLEVEPLVPPQIVLQSTAPVANTRSRISEAPDAEEQQTLAPGSSMKQQFHLRHRPSLFEGTTAKQVGFNVRYRVRSRETIEAAELDLTFRPPLRNLVTGAVIGALVAFFIGSYAMLLPVVEAIGSGDPSSPRVSIAEVIGALLLTLIAGVVGVIAAQSSPRGVTIEDFWGGMIAGFTFVLASSQLFQMITPTAGLGEHLLAPGTPTAATERAAAPTTADNALARSTMAPTPTPDLPSVILVNLPGLRNRPQATPVP